MLDTLISQYPTIIHTIPLVLLGFWTQQVLIRMKTNSKRQGIITSIETGESTNEELIDDNGKWLYIWLLGVAGLLILRFIIVLNYL